MAYNLARMVNVVETASLTPELQKTQTNLERRSPYWANRRCGMNPQLSSSVTDPFPLLHLPFPACGPIHDVRDLDVFVNLMARLEFNQCDGLKSLQESFVAKVSM